MKTACVKMDSRNLGEDRRRCKESIYVLNFWRKLNMQIFWALWSPTTKLGFIIMTQQQSINQCSWQSQSLKVKKAGMWRSKS